MKLFKKPTTKKEIIKKILWFVIVVHLVMFFVVIVKQTAGRPHFGGKAFMASAVIINTIYIFPLSKAFEPYNILTVPFYEIRDALYNMGWKLLPENDAEREMWWFAVRWNEYETIVEPELFKFKDGTNRLNPKVFEDWTDEIYLHLKPLALKPLKDNKFKTNRLIVYTRAAHWYGMDRALFIRLMDEDKDPDKFPFIRQAKEIDRIRNCLTWFNTLKAYCLKEEPIAYNKLIKNSPKTWVWVISPKFISRATLWIISHEILMGKLNCDSDAVKLHLKTREILLQDAAVDPAIPISMRKRTTAYLSEGLFNQVYQTIKKNCVDGRT